MGKNLIAISDFVSANKAKYVTPSMMVVEGEMELCMLQGSNGGNNDQQPPYDPNIGNIGGSGFEPGGSGDGYGE